MSFNIKGWLTPLQYNGVSQLLTLSDVGATHAQSWDLKPGKTYKTNYYWNSLLSYIWKNLSYELTT